MPSWIRIRNLNADPDSDPATQINADPDPKPWFNVKMGFISRALLVDLESKYEKNKTPLPLFLIRMDSGFKN